MPIAALIFLAFAWGANFIFMKWSLAYVTPAQIVLVRVVLGFIIVVVFAAVSGQLKRSHWRYAHHFFAMACLAATFYYYAFAVGTSLLPSGIAGAISGTVPLFAMLAGVLFIAEEKLSARKLLAVLVGFAGIVVLSKPFTAGIATASVSGALYMVVGSLCFGLSFVYARRFVSPLNIGAAALATYQFAFAILIQGAVTDTSGITAIAEDPAALVALVVGIGLLGTGVAFVAYYYIVDKLGLLRASTVTYLPPVIALCIGAIFVGEPIVLTDYVATAMILGAVFLSRQKR